MRTSTMYAAAALLLAIALPGCGDDESAEEAEHPSVVVTQWNDSTELFLEYPHMLVNEATGNWAIHLTDMKTFKPITAGTLTVRFTQAGNVIQSFDIAAPARDGIFLLDPVIDRAGTYEVQLALNSAQVKSTHTLPAVQVFANSAALPEPAEEPAGISFLKEQAWKISFAVQRAEEQEVARSIAAPGEIAAPDGSLVIVSAPVAGIALAAGNRNAPSVGQSVRTGQILAVLAPAAGGNGFARARGEIERLERELAREQRLYDAGAIPLKRLEETRHDLQIARAEMSAMGGGADGDFQLRVRAPLSGVVAQRDFVPGGPVQAGQPLFTIVDPTTVWLRVQLPAAAAASLPRDARASFTLEGSPGTFQSAGLVSVGNMLDPRTRTVPVVFNVDNRGGQIRVGQMARATVPVGGTVRGVVVPNSAILDDNGTPVAFVQISGETFERRVVTLGASDGTRTQVVDGIAPGEMVVTLGAYQIRLASLSPEGFSGGHAH
ncbi:MAG TPA: efflux RND transporter periplasmic adaptor subunit [Longimicrobiales bacterium]|nr:efflux RND transporter periplasmic adaptor subunit [Longimicrobiales bacterium]